MVDINKKILKFYPWLFGLLALCLPFQTRFLVSVGLRETETIALYAFDLILAALLLVSLIFGSKKNWCLAVGWFLAVWLWAANSMNIQIYWWLRILEAMTLGYLIYQKREIVFQPFMVGFTFGMLISSFFGVMQIWTQEVGANKWLGISGQLPWQPGASVLETLAGRLLRGYGIFPHPNIFGGLSALAIILFLSVKQSLPDWLKSKYIFLAVIAILLIGLWSSFSRSAWLGLIFGLAILIYQKKIPIRLILWIAALAVLLNGIWYQFSLDRVMLNNRLEKKSLIDRVVALETAKTIVQSHPWLGVGLGKFTTAAESVLKNSDPRYIEPVHNVYALVVGELGIVGVLIIVLLVVRGFYRLDTWAYPILVTILIIGFFDHYWWSITSARLAVALVIALSIRPKKTTQPALID